MNKLKGYGTSLEGWEKWGDIWVISLKVKNIFDFTFFLYKPIRRGKLRQIFAFSFSHSRPLISSPSSSSSKFFLAENSKALQFFLLSRFVSWVFTLVLHVLWDACWWFSFKSWEMFYCHEIMFVWYEISRIWSCLLVNMKE